MRIDTDEFIRRSKAIHGDKYDYSKSVFVSSKKPIDIICKKHNYKFTLKRAQAHLQGSFQGCPICSAEKIAQYYAEMSKATEERRRKKREEKAKLPKKRKPFVLSEEKKQEIRLKCKKTRQERFLRNARAKYGDTYDYSLVEYQGREIPVKIICKVHGVFPITPRTFLQGQSKHPSHGCPKCDGIKEQKSTKITQDVFLQTVREKHGEKWDLSTVQYRNKHQILGLSCPDCNESFNTTTEKLMDGLGCPRCEGRIKDLRYYVEEAKKVHGDKYDYSECYLTYERKHQVLNNIRFLHEQVF
jgi:predicted  nucleic acid-binding Zn-ribbon protein